MSFDAWVVGFGFSRVLIELNFLVESPWAYVVLVLTLLIDSYLLYMLFTRRAASRRLERTLLTPGAPSGPDNRIASEMTEPPYDPLARLNTDLGYVVGILAIAVLVFAVLPSIRLP